MNRLIESFLKGQEQMTGNRLRVRLMKDDVFYTVVPDGKRQCIKCVNFNPVLGTTDGAGTCDIVNGIILPDAHCDEWSAR